MKKCSECELPLPETAFPVLRTVILKRTGAIRQYRHSYCGNCLKQYNRRWQREVKPGLRKGDPAPLLPGTSQ